MAPSTKTAAGKSRPMNIEQWPIDRPKPYAKNARKWSAKAIEKIAASIREFGWRQPIVCDRDDVIIIGHLRLAAARYLGLKEVPVHVAADLTPQQVKALRIADNRLHEEAGWDEALLGPELIDLKIADFNLDFTGFETDEIIESVFGSGKRKGKGAKSKAVADLESRLEIIVSCASEESQAALLERLTNEGYECRALIS